MTGWMVASATSVGTRPTRRRLRAVMVAVLPRAEPGAAGGQLRHALKAITVSSRGPPLGYLSWLTDGDRRGDLGRPHVRLGRSGSGIRLRGSVGAGPGRRPAGQRRQAAWRALPGPHGHR